ncbi:GspMb/PilO family protein [Chitiniphilus shinanonensis]|uniref:GspMb/PilO family protein n=1 Tax=Chitiniphilus shinanonensis TaxID=553088 RepID=UPI00303D6F5B
MALKSHIPRLNWLARRAWATLRPAGLAGLGLLLLAAVLGAQSWQRNHEIARIEAALKTSALPGRLAPPTALPRDDLRAFYAALPTTRDLPRLLQQVFETAEQHQLQLVSGQYRALPDQRAGVLRYQIQLPVHGRYEAIVGLVDDLLQRMPTLAIDAIHLSREQVDSVQLDAELHLLLLLRLDENGPATRPEAPA